jgi:hypothetical protein
VPQNWTSSGICRSPVWTSCSPPAASDGTLRPARRDPAPRALVRRPDLFGGQLHRLLGTTDSRR